MKSQLILEMANQARIEEYSCSAKLYAGDLEGAKQAAERAHLMRQAFMKIVEKMLNETDCDK